MAPKSTSLFPRRSVGFLAATVVLLVSLQAQTPPGYISNRNLADPGPGDPPPLTAAQRSAAPVVNATVAAQAITEIRVPAEFDVKVFATPPQFNSPTAIAAAPDGTVYVAGDGNGASHFFPHMGHIVRLRDTNGDGRRTRRSSSCPTSTRPAACCGSRTTSSVVPLMQLRIACLP